jgi:phosphohistidine phosphatase
MVENIEYKLILMRHSKAEPDNIIGDRARELTPIGRKKAKHAAKKMLKKEIHPDLIVCSPAPRAFQTAEIVACEIDYTPEAKIAEIEALYLAGPQEMLNEINQISEKYKTVIIVAHEPTVSQTAALLGSKLANSETLQELQLGLSTANYATLKSIKPFSQWTSGSIEKVKITHVE